MSIEFLQKKVKPDGEGLVNCLKYAGTPSRVHFIELYLDREIEDAVCSRFNLLDSLDKSDPNFEYKRYITVQRFLGYDFVKANVENLVFPLNWDNTADSASALGRTEGRMFINEHKGPITSREEFDKYPWPDPSKFTTKALEWYEKNLPDDMIVIGGLTGSFFENISWLMGYETMCFALLEQPDLVEDIAVRLREIYSANVSALVQFDRVRIIWGSDDMGFKGGLMISPDHMRQYVLESHKLLASMVHKAGRQYILHSCGKLDDIYNELPESIGIDGKHSYEDTIESISDVKKRFTGRMAVLGGIDVDFLCRATHDAIRARVRDTINSCQQGGGFCLGTGNTVANYIPLDNYLVMLDEGRIWGM